MPASGSISVTLSVDDSVFRRQIEYMTQQLRAWAAADHAAWFVALPWWRRELEILRLGALQLWRPR